MQEQCRRDVDTSLGANLCSANRIIISRIQNGYGDGPRSAFRGATSKVPHQKRRTGRWLNATVRARDFGRRIDAISATEINLKSASPIAIAARVRGTGRRTRRDWLCSRVLRITRRNITRGRNYRRAKSIPCSPAVPVTEYRVPSAVPRNDGDDDARYRERRRFIKVNRTFARLILARVARPAGAGGIAREIRNHNIFNAKGVVGMVVGGEPWRRRALGAPTPAAGRGDRRSRELRVAPRALQWVITRFSGPTVFRFFRRGAGGRYARAPGGSGNGPMIVQRREKDMPFGEKHVRIWSV